MKHLHLPAIAFAVLLPVTAAAGWASPPANPCSGPCYTCICTSPGQNIDPDNPNGAFAKCNRGEGTYSCARRWWDDNFMGHMMNNYPVSFTNRRVDICQVWGPDSCPITLSPACPREELPTFCAPGVHQLKAPDPITLGRWCEILRGICERGPSGQCLPVRADCAAASNLYCDQWQNAGVCP